MRAAGVLLAVLAATMVAACSMLERTHVQGPTVVQLEVWNRTLDDVFLIDPANRLINVPACGHAPAAAIDISHVDMRLDAGRITIFGAGDGASPQFLVIVAAEGESFPTVRRPTLLPPCMGHPSVVPIAPT